MCSGCIDRVAQLEAYTNELAAAVKTFASHCRSKPGHCAGETTPHPLIIPETSPEEVHQARRSILANITRIQTILLGSADLLRQLALQTQLLACLQWLGGLQVLACIPLSGSVPVKDVADLTGVPESQLRRIVRMTTTTAGFLQQPQPDQVAHSALSVPFVTTPAYLDAAMFLAETVAPAALQTATATHRFGLSQKAHESAYNIAFNSSASFASLYERQARLQRQWPAYLRYGTGDLGETVTDIQPHLDTLQDGTATVVEVGATSTERAIALAKLYPSLQFIVQLTRPGPSTSRKLDDMCQGNPRITVQYRNLGTPQPVLHAAMYILHVPSASPAVPLDSATARIGAELGAHLNVVRMNPSARLVLTPRLLPDAGTVSSDLEAQALLRDLTLFQLSNDREMEACDLINLVNSVSDSMGRLVLVKKIRSPNSAAISLDIQYQAYADQ